MGNLGQNVEIHLSPLLTHEAQAMAGRKAAGCSKRVFLSFPQTLAICWAACLENACGCLDSTGVDFVHLGYCCTEVYMWHRSCTGAAEGWGPCCQHCVNCEAGVTTAFTPSVVIGLCFILLTLKVEMGIVFLKWCGTNIPHVDMHQNRIQG